VAEEDPAERTLPPGSRTPCSVCARPLSIVASLACGRGRTTTHAAVRCVRARRRTDPALHCPMHAIIQQQVE
jgi:hypothetical protein